MFGVLEFLLVYNNAGNNRKDKDHECNNFICITNVPNPLPVSCPYQEPSYHNRNNNKGDGDSLDSVSGSHGLTGGVDNALVMMNTGNGIELHINGRDIEDSSPISLSKNDDGMWTLESREKAEMALNSDTRNRVLRAVIDGIETPKDIIEETGLDSKVVEQQLYRMVNSGTLDKPKRGTYILAKTPTLKVSP